MEKIKNILLIVGILAVAFILYQAFAANSNLKKSVEILGRAEKKLDSASKEISYSRSRVDSLQLDFSKFSAYVKDMQGRVEILDLEKRLSQDRYKLKRDSILTRLKELYKTVEMTGEELPEVKIYDSRKDTIRYEGN